MSIKNPTLFAPIILILFVAMGCSTSPALKPTTPTSLPVLVSQATPETGGPTDLSDEPEVEPPAGDVQLTKGVTVDSISLRITSHFPVEGQVTVGGILKDDCMEIAGWEQSISGHTLFMVPSLSQREDEQCNHDQMPFKEDIDLDVQGLSVSELSNGAYALDVNGFMMAFFGTAVANSLLDIDVTVCPVGGESQTLYLSEQGKFCLLFPDTFEMRDDEAPGISGFYGPPLDETIEPLRALLYVDYREDARGRTLEEIAEEKRVADTDTEREQDVTPTFLDGQPAIQFEVEGERSRMKQVITLFDDTVYFISVSPYDDAFPEAAEDVERVWDLAFNSFTFIRIPLDQTEEQIISLDEFEGLLMEAIRSHNYEWLQAFMDDSFGFAFWLSEGYEANPQRAIDELQLTYLRPEHTITFEETEPDLSARLGENRDILSIWNPAANPVSALYSKGWGPEGDNEAFLIVTESPDGILAWDGMVIARQEIDGFSGP